MDYFLHYVLCGLGDLPLERSTSLVELFSDISYAPQGEKSVQGIVAMIAGATLQWETSRQSCLALSTAEAELYSYVEALTMGDSLQALWTEVRGETPEIVTYGDSQAAISIVRNPDGPWRTRHLRLRANVLRGRAQQGRWKIFHMAGTQLIADYLTKSITV